MIKNEQGNTVFYQWDKDRRVRIASDAAPVQVHFSGRGDKNAEAAAVVPYDEDGVLYADVPNCLLRFSGQVDVYLYCKADGGMRSIHGGTLTVLPREKPSDYVCTEEEVLSWHTIDLRMQALEEKAGKNGVTFTPHVTEEGVLYWTNDGTMKNPDPMNIRGPRGEDYVLRASDREEIAAMIGPGADGKDGKDGKDGADGKDGVTFTPQMSEDGTLSWTNDGGREDPVPVMLRGERGADGKDGVTFIPQMSEDGTLSWTNDGGREDPVPVMLRGERGADGKDGVTFIPQMSEDGMLSWTNDGGREDPVPVMLHGERGADGKDGVTFTPQMSEDGTLSWTNDGGRENPAPAVLRGERGMRGEDGKDGADYVLTADDRAEIAALAGVQPIEAPRFAITAADMTDPDKHYILNGTIHACVRTSDMCALYTNLADTKSNDWKNGYRLKSDGTLIAQAGLVTTNFIPVKKGDIIRIHGMDANTDTYARVGMYNASKSLVSSSKLSGISSAHASSISYDKTGGQFTLVGDDAYVRVCGEPNTTAEDIIITVNEEIGDSLVVTETWTDTGIPYALTVQSELIGVLGEDGVIYLSGRLPAGTYTLKYADAAYQTVGSVTVG